VTIERVASDGLELAVEAFGSGPPIVFAHGLTGNRQGTRAQLSSLESRYRIVSYDQRGHSGSTPVTDPALYAPDRMAEDMTAVLDSLGIQRAIVGGESMGAATTMLFALKHPERVEKLLITAPAFGDRPNPERQRLKDIGTALARYGMDEFLRRAAVRQRDELGWSSQVIEYVRANFASHDPSSLATALQTVADWLPFSDLRALAEISCPVHLIAWEQDQLHPFELAQRVAAAIPHARLETIPPLPAIFLTPEIVGRAHGRSLAGG
jgi:pimeloyl-ACP methyl ester carboxylesterase